MSINQNVDLNLSASIMPPVLHMAQGDSNSRTIVATLWDGTSGFTIPSDAVVMVRFGKPDGTGGLYDHAESGTAITYSGNVVTAPVATQMLSVAGKVQADIEIYQTGATAQAAVKLATFAFVVNVEKSPYSDAEIISSDYYNIISAQISAAVKAGEKADAAIAAAETAQNAATAAVNAKKAAESAKAAAENAKTTAVNSANTANSAKTAAESAKADAVSAKNAAAGSATAAAGSASRAKEDAQNAAQDADDAEAWAVGKRNGDDVPSTDPAYHNNAKYYKDQAQAVAGGEFISYGAPQSLTDAQQAQARDNIGAPAPYTPGDNISISGSVIATKAFPCNPNLLDNWYFGNPVNQRGQTSYTGAVYNVDRWKILNHPLSIQTGGIKVTCSSASAQNYALQQLLENPIIGEQYTISALILENTTTSGISFRNGAHGGATILGTGLFSYTFTADSTMETQGVGIQFYNRADDNGNYFVVKAIKLELGSQQTLAHQENGAWVLNEIPDYGEQLRRCQRYYWKVDHNNWPGVSPFAGTYNGERISLNGLTFPVTMRTKPTISNLILYEKGSGSSKTVTDSGWGLSDYAYNNIFPTSGNVVSGTTYSVQHVEFSADL